MHFTSPLLSGFWWKNQSRLIVSKEQNRKSQHNGKNAATHSVLSEGSQQLQRNLPTISHKNCTDFEKSSVIQFRNFRIRRHCRHSFNSLSSFFFLLSFNSWEHTQSNIHRWILSIAVVIRSGDPCTGCCQVQHNRQIHGYGGECGDSGRVLKVDASARNVMTLLFIFTVSILSSELIKAFTSYNILPAMAY
jgi:hypothetical protein